MVCFCWVCVYLVVYQNHRIGWARQGIWVDKLVFISAVCWTYSLLIQFLSFSIRSVSILSYKDRNYFLNVSRPCIS